MNGLLTRTESNCELCLAHRTTIEGYRMLFQLVSICYRIPRSLTVPVLTEIENIAI